MKNNKLWVTIFIILLIISFVCAGIYYYFTREENTIEYIREITQNDKNR